MATVDMLVYIVLGLGAMSYRTLIGARGGILIVAAHVPVTGFAADQSAGTSLPVMLGIGGGIVLTPTLILLFGFPPHIASATSALVLLVSALFGTASHLWLGHVQFGPAWAMAGGVVFGSQLGAAIALRIRAPGLLK